MLSTSAYAGTGDVAYAADAGNALVAAGAFAVFEAAPSTTGTGADESVSGEQSSIPDEETPRSILPYELGWSLVNLFLSLLTTIIGLSLIVFFVLQKRDGLYPSNSFGLTVFGMLAALISLILFVSTEDLQSQMIMADSFTVAHIALLTVAVLCAGLSMKKDKQSLVSWNDERDI
jgi:hypothetical protein